MDKPETNVADKNWFSNKQVASLFGFFIVLGVGYGEFRGMLGKSTLHDTQIEDNKKLIYNKSREGNDRQDRMVKPVRDDIKELKAWMNFEKGFQKGSTKRP